ncbi:AAA family ATPase [Microbulbifer magnicolonia]|uniref:AAA family ATPase n=1 Tax=Microbulbifer magnicolonia TaxID=3109744 RepID=UPI002B412E27|nr:AAA family ATPase [Microbulbifer sp. GG15]
MALTLHVLPPGHRCPNQGDSVAYLEYDNWDDYGHKTLFSLTVFDEYGKQHEIGNVKITFFGQEYGKTIERIPDDVRKSLPEEFYSLGQDADYYQNLVEKLSRENREFLLAALGDVVFNEVKLHAAFDERAFRTSLLRNVSKSSIEQQFARILRGEAPLTEYDFFYERAEGEQYSGIKVEFSVDPNTKPSSNIHILIGRNGVGKTTLLNKMVDALIPGRGTVEETGRFATNTGWGDAFDLEENYFAGVVSVSFSAFDPFKPPRDQLDANAGMKFSYVGLKKRLMLEGKEVWVQKDDEGLCEDLVRSLNTCFSLVAKRDRWISAVKTLESDHNFAEMDLCNLVNIYEKDMPGGNHYFSNVVSSLFSRMSSGHGIVLLTITKLIETVEEKTLILLDEPESHLHPPLLSAFTRALSDLLVNRNGVAIVATHSPVVLQEVPKSCVSIIRRTRLNAIVDRPEIETFAENVGVLTREVFGLEVSKSGFHKLLATSVATGKSYEEIELEYHHRLGFEGRTILRSMITVRDSQGGHE